MPEAGPFFVACLCAQWCGSCREYQPAFEALGQRMPGVVFAWVDVEDQPDIAGDIEIDNFPTLVIQRGEWVLFCGPMLPHIAQLERLIQSFLTQSAEALQAYATATPARQALQGLADVQTRILRR